MSSFLRNAQQILGVAQSAAGADCDLAMVVGPDGSVRVVEGAGWQVESLRAHFGARAAYRVRRLGTAVRIEGSEGGVRCVLEGEGTGRRGSTAADRILTDRPAYRVQRSLCPA